MNNINKYIRKRRKDLLLTQEYVALQSGISLRGYQKIEYNEVSPKLETLEKISICFNENLILKLNEFSYLGLDYFTNLQKEIFNTNEINKLTKLKMEVTNFFLKSEFEIFSEICHSLEVYTQAKIAYLKNNFLDSIYYLDNAIKILKLKENINKKNYFLSEYELKIIILLSYNYKKINRQDIRLDLLTKIKKNITPDNNHYAQYMYNIGFCEFEKNNYEVAIKYFNNALNSFKKKNGFKNSYHLLCHFTL